jgi:hypothetical protein
MIVCIDDMRFYIKLSKSADANANANANAMPLEKRRVYQISN